MGRVPRIIEPHGRSRDTFPSMVTAQLRLVPLASCGSQEDRGAVSEGAFARGAHEPTLVVALKADPVKELFPDSRMVAVAHRRHHMTAIVAEVLHGPAGRDELLVRDQSREHEEQNAHHRAYDPTCEAEAFGLEGEGGPQAGHAAEILVLGLMAVLWFVRPRASRRGCLGRRFDGAKSVWTL